MSTTQETVDALLLLGTPSEGPVSAEWVQAVIARIGRVSQDELAKMDAHLMACWGSSVDGVTGVQRDPLKKIALLERALMLLSEAKCQDTRTENEKTSLPIVEVERLPDEAGGVERVLRPKRQFHVHDPLAFNSVLRRLQHTHPDWPNNSRFRETAPRTTKGITQPLQALGFGPVKGSPCTHRIAGARGPPDTDPDKTLVEGVWKTIGASRDGLYFRKYVYDATRVHVATNIRYMWTLVQP
jgi:hypothetical protein